MRPRIKQGGLCLGVPAVRGPAIASITAVVIAMVGLAGCGMHSHSGQSAATAGATVAASAKTGTGASTTGTAARGAGAVDLQPVSLLYTFESGGMSGTQLENLIQGAITACMQRQGFRYFPTISPPSAATDTVGQLQKFRATYGYGITTITPSSALGTQDPGKTNDPTQAYLATLSPSAQVAFYQALDGTDTPSASTQTGNAPLLPPADAKGCSASAERSVLAPLPAGNQALQAAVARAEATITSDPRLAAAWSRWSACMATQGFRYRSENQVVQFFLHAEGKGGGNALIPQEISTASADFSCWLTDVHPVQRSLDRAQLDNIVQQFPAYARYLPA